MDKCYRDRSVPNCGLKRQTPFRRASESPACRPMDVHEPARSSVSFVAFWQSNLQKGHLMPTVDYCHFLGVPAPKPADRRDPERPGCQALPSQARNPGPLGVTCLRRPAASPARPPFGSVASPGQFTTCLRKVTIRATHANVWLLHLVWVRRFTEADVDFELSQRAQKASWRDRRLQDGDRIGLPERWHGTVSASPFCSVPRISPTPSRTLGSPLALTIAPHSWRFLSA